MPLTNQFDDLNGQRTTVRNGVAVYEYRINSNTPVGEYTLKGTYLENETYKSSSDTATLNVRIKTIAQINTEFITNYEESLTIDAQVMYDNNSPVDSGIVEFYINNTLLGTATVIQGVASYTIYSILSSYKTGDKIKAVYKGDNTYSPCVSNEATLKIRKDVTIIVSNIIASRGENAEITFDVVDSNNAPVDGTCNLIVDGNRVSSLVLDEGSAGYSYAISQNLDKDVLPVRIEYIENDNYKDTSATTVINIRKPVTVTCTNVSANAGESVSLTITIIDNHNVGVTGGKVNVTVGNNTTQQYSVSNDGIATFQYTVGASETGTINYTATYVKNDNYESGTSSVAGIITIRKAINITVEDVTVNVGETVPLIARITDNNNTPVNVGYVEFEIVGS